ncbi:MAG: hypothetical protein WCD21_37655 [Streptomyces sp.]
MRPGRGSEVARAWEGSRRGTPVEVCVLGRYRYKDRYDYMAQDRIPGMAPSGRLAEGGYRVSAECEKGGERALFTVEPPGSRSPSYHSVEL